MIQVMHLSWWRIVNSTCLPAKHLLLTRLQPGEYHNEYLYTAGTRIPGEPLQWTTIKGPNNVKFQPVQCTALPEIISRMEPRTREWSQHTKLEPDPVTMSSIIPETFWVHCGQVAIYFIFFWLPIATC